MTEYEKKAADFLAKHNLTLDVDRAHQTCPPWKNVLKESKHGACAVCGDVHGDKFNVVLKRENKATRLDARIEGRTVRVSFEFWGSYNDAQKDKEPSAYDVLSCISGDVYTPVTFSEFCAEYGYNEDSIRDRKTFIRANRLAKKLRAFFSQDEIDDITEIQ